jgi:hypothetical protein
MKQHFYLLANVILLMNLTVHAQSSDSDRRLIRIKHNTENATIIYDIDSVKFYFRKSSLIKYLNGTIEDLPKKEDISLLAKINKLDTAVLLVKNALKLDPSKEKLDFKDEQTMYAVALARASEYLLLKGEVRIFNVKRHVFVNKFLCQQNKSENIVSLQYLDGNRFYYYSPAVTKVIIN